MEIAPMIRWTFILFVAAGPLLAAETAAERGKKALLGKSYVPPTMALTAYDDAWKHWGLKEKPAAKDYARLFRQRYGLHPAPYANDGYPMGVRVAASTLPFTKKKMLTVDCLLCHGGSRFGKSYVGLGNSTLDFQAFYEEMNATAPRRAKTPFTFSQVRGTSEAGGMAVYLLGFREPSLSLRLVRRDLDLHDDLCEDPPAWWILKKKKTMYHTGGGDVRSVRSIMQFMLSPLNPPDAFEKEEPTFRDILAYLRTIEPPKYPFPIDQEQARKGEQLFLQNW